MSKRQDPNPYAFELTSIVDEFLRAYYDSEATQEFYRDQLRAFRAFATARDLRSLDQLTPALVVAYLDGERLGTYQRGPHTRRHSPGTVAHRYRSLKRLCNWAIQQGYLQENPVQKVREPRVPKSIEPGFGPDEVKLLVKQSRRYQNSEWLGKRDHAIVLTLLLTGCRADGLLTMAEGSIDWTRNRIKLTEKGRKDRFVPMGPRLRDALKDYMAARDKALPLRGDFWRTQRGDPLTYSALSKLLENMGKYAGVAHVHPHRFRRTFACVWYAEHGNLLALRNLLGHTDITITEIYLRGLGFVFGTTAEEFHTLDNVI